MERPVSIVQIKALHDNPRLAQAAKFSGKAAKEAVKESERLYHGGQQRKRLQDQERSPGQQRDPRLRIEDLG